MTGRNILAVIVSTAICMRSILISVKFFVKLPQQAN